MSLKGRNGCRRSAEMRVFWESVPAEGKYDLTAHGHLRDNAGTGVRRSVGLDPDLDEPGGAEQVSPPTQDRGVPFNKRQGVHERALRRAIRTRDIMEPEVSVG